MRPEVLREARLLCAAVACLTRCPVPSTAFAPDWLPRSAKYFPLIGAAVGLLAAAVLLVGSHLWPAPIPALLAVLAALVVTGALHEDGIADTADGLGGRTREARLAIMKDPRLGSFGALALLMALALRVAALSVMPAALAATVLVAAGAGSRFAAVGVMWLAPYGGDPGNARMAHGPGRPRGGEVALAALFGLAPLALLAGERALVATLLGGTVAALVAITCCRSLGGYTGDVLGATVVGYETAFLLGAAAGPAS